MPLLRVFLRVDHVYVHVFSITFLRLFHFLNMKQNIVHSLIKSKDQFTGMQLFCLKLLVFSTPGVLEVLTEV